MIYIKLNLKKIIISIIFISYFITVLLSISGYSESELEERTYLTEEQINKFERDIKENKSIDIDEYIVPKKNYDNKYSKAGRNISKKFDNITSNILKKVFKILNKAIEEK